MTALHSRFLARLVAGLILLMSVAGLAGWIWNIPLFKSVAQGWPSQAPLSALAFMLAAISLGGLASAPVAAKGSAARRLSQVCAVLIVSIGAYRIAGYLVGWSHDLDGFGTAGLLAAKDLPDRMAHATALGLVVIVSCE